MIASIEPDIANALNSINIALGLLNAIPMSNVDGQVGYTLCEAIDELDFAMRCLDREYGE